MKNNTIVIIPHYNQPQDLYKSISSFSVEEKIDLFIIDDGSSIKPSLDEIKKNFRCNGEVILQLERENKGIEHVLNQGLDFALSNEYEFTARMDCGDFCKPNRFNKQIQFLTENKKIGIVGTKVKFFDVNSNKSFICNLPTTNEIIQKKMYLNSMLIHPTIMFRTECLLKTGKYPTTYKAAEDLAFFFQFMKHFPLANLDEVLVECELNPNGISGKKRKQQVISRTKLILDNFHFGFYPIYGLIRNLVLLIVPYSFIKSLKYLKK